MFFTSYSQGARDNLASMGDLSLAQMKNLAEIAQKYFNYGVNNYVHVCCTAVKTGWIFANLSYPSFPYKPDLLLNPIALDYSICTF